jgi:hypothetical protein
MWTGVQDVYQGTWNRAPAEHYLGCVTYGNSYQQLCDAFGQTVPREVLVIDSAMMKSVSRAVVKETNALNTVQCMVAPGSINWGSQPARYTWLGGVYSETWFSSPHPGNSRVNFNFANPDALRMWTYAWMGIGPYYFNGLVLRDDEGKVNTDGKGAVKLYPHRAPWVDWALRLTVRFAYVLVPYSPPTWW